MPSRYRSSIALLLFFTASQSIEVRPCSAAEPFDVIIRGGTIYDGSGGPSYVADVGLRGDKISAIGDLAKATTTQEVNARGLAVAPGFINMLSWATESLLHDPRSLSDIRQGVTLEVFGEGWSMGPLSEAMRQDELDSQGDIKYEIPWRKLSEYLQHLEQRGVSPNVASFIGATTLRIHTVGFEDRRPTTKELQTMRELVRDEMEQGALGIGSSLIYAPAFYADTNELIELCKVAAEYDGLYISHIRSEGNQLLEAVDELIKIAREANIAAEIYHLKAAGKDNWGKLDAVIQKVEDARAKGLRITADMYTYTAGATGLNASMPPWVQEGGFNRWQDRLRDPATRAHVVKEMRNPTDEWENLLLMAGSAEKVLLVGFKNPDLKHLTGRSLADVARQRGKSPEETAMDLVVEDGSRVGCVYFLMSENNVKKKLALPWVSFCSDSSSLAPEGVFLKSNAHPRAYGSFSRVVGKYVRDEKVISLETAVRKLTGLPATNLGIRQRGWLKLDYFADIVVFDPATVQDHATFDEPHQHATGVRDVFVNGQLVLHDGEHTGATPGRVVRGPGYWRSNERRGLVELTAAASDVHKSGFVFDGHNDLPWAIRTNASSSFAKMDISEPQPKLHTDIARLRQGNLGAQFWSVYVPAETAKRGNALLQTLEQIELVHAMMERYPDTFEFARTVDDIERIQSSGKIASLIGVEGGHSIENSLGTLRRLHKLGAAYMTLTHSDTLAWADSATDDPKHGGLSAFGEEVVREMNRLGMLVDLSHVSPDTMKDALRVSKAPIIFSHSSARSVADHPRNVPDDVLLLTKDNGGVVMVNFFSGFVEPESARRMAEMFAASRQLREQYPEEADYQKARAAWRLKNPILPGTIHDVVDHIDHIVRVAGVDHVGIGSDYDGVSSLPKQLEDVSTYPLITQALLTRGYTAEEIHKIMSGNILRAMREAEAVATSER
ncbi:MAG: membrane dipeptidase [Planctomycetes bacterium]|nr:membrane dipeptidase [Planctomycetota bacterium]